MTHEYIFVYGTLKRNTHSKMHHFLAKYAEFVDNACYRGKLYNISYYPGVIPSHDPDDVVFGEVYLLQCADFVIASLDQYEECGPDFPEPNEYIRKQQDIFLGNGDIVTAWVYIYNHSTEGLEQIKPADFLTYLSLA
ncbi:MAG: gamma-glutamylcyclotransferase family protein [Methylococcaceae bacterium]